MSESHDPLREWHVQKGRAELVLDVCAKVAAGQVPPTVAAAALMTAGVEPAMLGDLMAPEAPRDAHPELFTEDLLTAAAEIDRLARAGTRCLVAVGWRSLEAHDALEALGWKRKSEDSTMVQEGAVPIRLARSVEGCRGPNVGAVWLVCVGPEIRKQASRVLRQSPGVMLVTSFGMPVSPEALPAVLERGGVRYAATRWSVDGDVLTATWRRLVQVDADPTSDVVATADRSEDDPEPVLPPGCTLDDKGPESWRWCVRGRGRGIVGAGRSPTEAVQDAWRGFSAFMSREEYEALEREAGRAIVDRRTAERFDGLSWQDVSGHLDQIAEALGITGVWHLRDLVAKCEALVNVPGQGLSRRVRELTRVLDDAKAALRRAGFDGLSGDLGGRIDALAAERDARARDWAVALGERDEAQAAAARLDKTMGAREARAEVAERLADQAEKRTEAHRVEVSRLTDTVHRLRADLAEARQVREKLASVTIEGKRYGLVDLGPA